MAQQDDHRFGALYEMHRLKVWLYCRRRVGPDRAEDVMGDVFLTVWRRIDEAPEPVEALPWLYRISHLTVLNHRRSLGRRRRLETKASGMAQGHTESIVDQVVVREEVRAVVDLLPRLKPADAEVLRLAAWERLNTEQIAAVLDIGPDAAKQRLSRARKRLTRMFDKKHKITYPPLLRREVTGEQ